DDLTGEALKQYEADIEVVNLILISIPNDIYNSVDSCQTAREMWLRVERLMQGAALTVVDRETQFNNEFDQFIVEPGESLVSVRLAKDLTKVSYDDLFDYLQQYENLFIGSRAKKLEKTHDPLALVAHTKVSLTTAMMLLARAITQCYSTPTNNQLRSSSNRRNQAVLQADRVNIKAEVLEMMVELQDVHTMFKKKLLRVAMFRKRLGMYKEIFKLLLLEMLQMFNATIAIRKVTMLVIVQTKSSGF
ncbi:hypothetical protein Tco_0075686, partial [Tanacetum coccineum]